MKRRSALAALLLSCVTATGAFAQQLSHDNSAVSHDTSAAPVHLASVPRIDLPADFYRPQQSPSDLPEAEVNSIPAQNDERSLAPLTQKAINRDARAVSISTVGIGTGVVPVIEGLESEDQPAAVAMPNGYDRQAIALCKQWRAPEICHNPLYFEETMLERNGHVRFGCFQGMASGARFFTTLTLMPYLKTLRPKHSCVYNLGHWRPGTCAPKLRNRLPYDRNAALVQTSAAAAFFWATPL